MIEAATAVVKVLAFLAVVWIFGGLTLATVLPVVAEVASRARRLCKRAKV